MSNDTSIDLRYSIESSLHDIKSMLASLAVTADCIVGGYYKDEDFSITAGIANILLLLQHKIDETLELVDKTRPEA